MQIRIRYKRNHSEILQRFCTRKIKRVETGKMYRDIDNNPSVSTVVGIIRTKNVKCFCSARMFGSRSVTNRNIGKIIPCYQLKIRRPQDIPTDVCGRIFCFFFFFKYLYFSLEFFQAFGVGENFPRQSPRLFSCVFEG